MRGVHKSREEKKPSPFADRRAKSSKLSSTKIRDGKFTLSVRAQNSTKRSKEIEEDNDVSMFHLSREAQKSVTESVNKRKAQHQHILDIQYEGYEYPFENIAFEGGGTKGMVYVGALQVLEEVGVKLKRFAGASAGSFMAALLAAGYSAAEITEIMSQDLQAIFLDHSCGWCSLLPNILRGYGWNPGHAAEDFFGDLLDKKLNMGPDITFKQLYQATGNELCITAVNVNMIRVEYFHQKTTPDVPVKLALRMSISIPGVFQAVKIRNEQGQKDMYVDGGILCNYPVHVFDGWWLSMKTEDCFLNRLQPLSDFERLMSKNERFGEYNEKTIGCLVYSESEQDVMKAKLEERVGLKISESDRPKNSKLYKKYREKQAHRQASNKSLEEHEVFMSSFDKLLKILQQVNSTGDEIDDTITRSELKQALDSAINTEAAGTQDEKQFSVFDVEILFGEGADLDEIFDQLDDNGDGEISYWELLKFIEKAGIDVASKLQGYQRKDIKSFAQFLDSVQDSLLTNSKYLYLEDRDFHRTVGINTDYIDTMDYNIDMEDRKFLWEQGRRAMISFLRHYVDEKKPQKKAVTQSPKPTNGIPALNITLAYDNDAFVNAGDNSKTSLGDNSKSEGTTISANDGHVIDLTDESDIEHSPASTARVTDNHPDVTLSTTGGENHQYAHKRHKKTEQTRSHLVGVVGSRSVENMSSFHDDTPSDDDNSNELGFDKSGIAVIPYAGIIFQQ